MDARDVRYGTGFDANYLGPEEALDSESDVNGSLHLQNEDFRIINTNNLSWASVDCNTRDCESIVEVSIRNPMFFKDRLYTNVPHTIEKYLSTPFTWRGVEWTVLVMKHANEEIFYYLGIEDLSKLPYDFALATQFVVSVVDINDNIVFRGSLKTRKIFQYSTVSTRDDLGGSELFIPQNKDAIFKYMQSYFHQHDHESIQRNQHFHDSHLNAQHPSIDYSRIKPFTLRLLVQIRVPFMRSIPPNQDSRIACGMVGILNLGATCYLNALLQMLFHIDGFRRLVFAMPHQNEIYGSSTTLGIQEVFKNLQFNLNTVDTRDLLRAFGWGNAEALMQQDVQEMMRVLLDKIEEKAKGTVCDGRIKDLFCGTVRSFISCKNVEYESKREEDFYDIQLDVNGSASLYESFKRYTASEMLEGDNQYDAGPEFGKQDARKGVIFTKLPPVLTIHLKRFDFDVKHMCYRKIHDIFAFSTWTNLDEFIAADAPEECRTGNDYILHSVLVHSGDFGGGHYYAYIRPMSAEQTDFDYALHVQRIKYQADQAMRQYRAEVQTGLRMPDAQINVDRAAYNLQERMDQLGRGGKWYKFDDEHVFEVADEEAIDYCFGRSDSGINQSLASAYMLLYIRHEAVSDVMRRFDQNSDDIPKSLARRLNAEAQLKGLQMRLKQQNKDSWSTIHIFTEATLQRFSMLEAGNKNNILTLAHAQKIEHQVLNDSLSLRAYLKAAQFLNVSPFRVCLYQTFFSKELETRKIGDRLPAALLTQKCSDCITRQKNNYYLFAETATDADVKRLGMEEVEKVFNAAWEQCQRDETLWIQNLRDVLYANPCPDSELDTNTAIAEGTAAAQVAAAEHRRLIDGLTSGYGMGGPNSWQDLVREANANSPVDRVNHLIAQMHADLDRLQNTVVSLLGSEGPFAPGPLLIFKVFDPAGMFDDAIAANMSAKMLSNYKSSDAEDTAETPLYNEDYIARLKHFKFLATKRMAKSPHIVDGSDSLVDSPLEPESECRDVALSMVQDAVRDLPGISASLLRSMPQWRFYVGKALHLTSADLLNNFSEAVFPDCAVIVIDMGYVSTKASKDPAALMYPGIDDSYEAWSSCITQRRTLTCFMLNNKFNEAAIRGLMSSKECEYAPSSLHAESSSEDAAEELPEIPAKYSRFMIHLQYGKEDGNTLHDAAQFIGLQLGVDPNKLILWTIRESNIKSDPEFSPRNLTMFDFKSETSNAGLFIAKGGTSEPIPTSVNSILYSIAPYPVVVRDSQNDNYHISDGSCPGFCIAVTDARLQLWRRLLRHCVHQRVIDTVIPDSPLHKRHRQATDLHRSHVELIDAETLAFSVNDEMLRKLSKGCAFLSQECPVLKLHYRRAHIDTLCALPPEQRELHLMDSYIFHEKNAEDGLKIGDLMSELRSIIGIPTNVSDVYHALIWLAEYVCADENKLDGLDLIPTRVQNSAIGKVELSTQAYVFAQTRAQKFSSILTFFSDAPSQDHQAVIDAEISQMTNPLKRVVQKIILSNSVFNSPSKPKREFMLALLDIRDSNSIQGVYFHDLSADCIHKCWPTAASGKDWPNTWMLALQMVRSVDIPYMSNADASVRSMVVQVLSFLKLDGSMEFCAEEVGQECGHVLTYVREDDTYARLAARVAILIGATHASELEMYVAHNPVGRRFQKPQIRALPNMGETSDDNGTVWDCFKAFYPLYASKSHSEAKLEDLTNTPFSAGQATDNAHLHFPILALRVKEELAEEDSVDEIQAEEAGPQVRPRSNSASSASSIGIKRRKSSQIMIN